MLSSKRSTSSTSATAFTSSPAVVTFANQRRCSPLEEKHRLDEHHCLHQQQSPPPTHADALLEEKRQLDERHCLHQQQSPSPTTTDARLSR
jgi:hypothetical protein